ncbi:MAG: hypothetical protein WDM79_08710 [Terricaulis sp.]
MSLRRRTLLSGAGALMLTGCSYSLGLAVLNNCGHRIELLNVSNAENPDAVPEARTWAWQRREPIYIEPGDVSGLYGAPKWGGSLLVRIDAGGCRRRYRVINAPDTYIARLQPIGRPHDVVLQIEPDFSLHLIPEGTRTPVDVTDYASWQEAGFPIRPYEEDCNP